MSDTPPEDKSGPSGQALSKQQIVEGKKAQKGVKVSAGGSKSKQHTIIEGVAGRVPWYSQAPGNTRPSAVASWTWGRDPMNVHAAEPKPICDVGCGLTAAAMILGYYGHAVTPGELNTFAQLNGVYEPLSNCIQGWNRLFSYGGASLLHVPGSLVNNGLLSNREEAKNPTLRKALFKTARDRVEQGLPTLARVDYVGDSSGSHAPFGDHFVVIVGVHADGHLLINDPGRFIADDLDIGNGAKAPDLRDNWIAENPANGTTKNGGYTLMRLDRVDVGGPPLTEATWKPWAQDEFLKVVNAFVPRLLGVARRVVLAEVQKFFDRVTPTAPIVFKFQPARLDLFKKDLTDEAASILRDQHTDFANALLAIIDEVGPRGFVESVAIEAPSKLAAFVAALPGSHVVEGVVKRVAEVIPAGPRLLSLKDLAVGAADFVDLLKLAREAMTTPLEFRLEKVKRGSQTLVGASIKAELLTKISEQATWADFDADGTVTFLFANPTELAEAVLVKALTFVGLIKAGQFAGALTGLVAAEDRQRLQRSLEGNVRLEVKADANTLSPQKVSEVLAVEGDAAGKLFIDFEVGASGRRAVMKVDVGGQADIRNDQMVVGVALQAKGTLVATGKTFAPIFGSPVAEFDNLMESFLTTLDGNVRIEIKANGGGHATVDTNIGLFRVQGDANLKLVLEYSNHRVVLDWSGAGAGHIDYHEHSFGLALRTNGGARFTVPSPPTFIQLWKNKSEKLNQIFDKLINSVSAHATIEVTAHETFNVGPLKFKSNETFTLELSPPEAILKLNAHMLGQSFDLDDKTVELVADGAVALHLSLRAIDVRKFFKTPQASFGLLLDELPERLVGKLLLDVRSEGGIAIKDVGFIHAEAGLAIELDGQAVSVKVGGNATLSLPRYGLELTLGLNAEAGLPWQRKIEGATPRRLLRDPEVEFPKMMSSFFEHFEGHARAEIDVNASIDGAHPLAMVREKLSDYGIASLMGNGKVIVNYWKKPGQQYVIVKFDVSSGGTTTLLSGATLSIESTGVCRIADRDLRQFVKQLPTELSAIQETVANTLATTTMVRLLYKGVLVRANVEEVFQARKCWDAGKYSDGLLCLMAGGWITLPDEPERPVAEIGTLRLAAIALQYFAGWASS